MKVLFHESVSSVRHKIRVTPDEGSISVDKDLGWVSQDPAALMLACLVSLPLRVHAPRGFLLVMTSYYVVLLSPVRVGVS